MVLNPSEKIKKEGNTTTYKVKAFNSGTEQTIEDVLKRLPGIEVLKNGTIKAHGKFIDKLLIEGEDMFDKNYTILSKNLDAKVLDAVEILDEFEDNPILAKVITSEKVALNLVLKEGYKNIWFGNASLGLGTKDRVKLASNIGLIRKKIKFFNFNNYNNLGTKASDQLEEASSSVGSNTSFREQKIESNANPIYTIANTESSVFKEGQSTFNNAFINALSFVTSVTPNLKLRGTAYYSNDNEDQLFSSKTTFNTNEPPVVYTESSNTKRNNEVAGGEIELKYAGSEKSYFKNVLVYNNKPETTTKRLLFNDNAIIESLEMKNQSVNNHLNHSYLLGHKKALHSYFYFGQNTIKQQAHIKSPVLNTIFSQPDTTTISNISKDRNAILGGKSTMLIRFGDFESHLEVGYESLTEKRENQFLFQDSENYTAIDSLQNTTNYKQHTLQFKSNLNYALSKHIELSAGLSLDYIDVNAGYVKNNDWILSPRARLGLKNLKIGALSFSYSKSYSTPQANILLPNYQLGSYNTFKRGTQNIKFPRRNSYTFNYRLKNNKQTKTVSIRMQYVNSNGKYSTENRIGQDLLFSSSKFVDSEDVLSSNIDFTSYFKKLKLSTNLGTSQNWTNSLVQVNTSGFQYLESYTSSYFLSGTTYFKLPINLKFKFIFNTAKSIFNSIESKTNWETVNLDFTYKLSKTWIATLQNKFYRTTDGNYSFTDVNLDYTPKKSRFSYQLVFNNLNNENVFTINNISEFTTYKSSTQLLPRYVFGLVKYRF